MDGNDDDLHFCIPHRVCRGQCSAGGAKSIAEETSADDASAGACLFDADVLGEMADDPFLKCFDWSREAQQSFGGVFVA